MNMSVSTRSKIFASSIAAQVVSQLQKPKLVRGYSGILIRVKNFLVEHGDPLVTHNIHGYDLELPLSHKLPEILEQWPHYSSNLGRLANCVYQKYPSMTLIDIGANIGDSIAILRELSEFPILCIDGDRDFLEILRRNVKNFSDVDVAPFFIGDEEIFVSAKSSGFGGTAHLTYLDESSNLEKIEIKTLDGILEQYPRFSKSKMVKIDTDGFDCKIIRGSIDFLKISKPVIFFEYDPFFLAAQGDDGLSVFPLLMEYGYSGVIIYDNYGDLVVCMPEIDQDRLEELHLYFSGRKSQQYYDICVFHSEDQDIFNQARMSEMEFIRNLKSEFLG
jgi:FkbM family methyltransferase